MQPGKAPKPVIIRHILSAARAQSPSHLSAVPKGWREPLKVSVTVRATRAAANCPKPCMANTEPIMAPRHLVVANLTAIRRVLSIEGRIHHSLRSNDG